MPVWLMEEGKTLEVGFTIDDPGAFNAPWSARVLYRRGTAAQPLTEEACAEQSVVHLGEFFKIPLAAKPDF